MSVFINLLLRLAAFSLLVTLVFATPASAALIESSDPGFPGGANNVTQDTDTGLEWLDWTASTGFSYGSMLPLLDPGQTYDGWRHATRDEVKAFIVAAGGPVTNWPAFTSVQDNGVSISPFVALVGTTSVADGSTFGMTADPAQAQYHHVAFAQPVATVSATSADGARYDLSGNNAVGHALVRSFSVIPEPSSLLLLGVVGLGIIAVRTELTC